MAKAPVDEAATRELAEAPVGRLLWRYALPAIVASTVASLYNLVDRVLVGHGVGAMAISGLALTLPFMNLAIAVGAMVGAGAASLVSLRLGEGRPEEAERILGNTVVLNAVLGSVYSGLMFLFLDPLLALLGGSPATSPYARQFLLVILVGNPFLHSFMGLNGILRASGHPRKAMGIMLGTVGVNLVLAPIFLFGFGWGIRGTALATVVGQLCGLVATIVHFADPSRPLRFRRGIFRVEFRIVRDILSIGVSALVMQVGASLVSAILNLELVRHGGDYAVGAFGIVNSVLMLGAMTVMGIVQGMQPVAGFNYGAGAFARCRRALGLAAGATTAVTLVLFLACQLLPGPVAGLFTGDPVLRREAAGAMRTVLALFPLVGFQMTASGFFQSIGRAKLSVFLSASRQGVFLIPALLLFPSLWGLAGVWASVPVADGASALVAAWTLRRELSRLDTLGSGGDPGPEPVPA